MIADCDIPAADPAAVITQYEPYIQKIANRYDNVLQRSGAVGKDDLMQAGRIAVTVAQKKYKPELGSFMNLLFYYVRKYMRRTLGINPNTGMAPEQLIYLDAPISETEETTLGDTVSDPDSLPLDEALTDAETRQETAEQVHAAIARLNSDKQREAIRRVWLEGETRETAAAKMGTSVAALRSIDNTARKHLMRDKILSQYVMPSFAVGLNKFRITWTSATEAAVIWREIHMQQMKGE